MKLDWDLIRVIMAHAEAETLEKFLKDAEGLSKWKEGQTLSERINSRQPQEVAVVLRHLKLLISGGYLEGVFVNVDSNGCYSCGINSPEITLEGYELLETLRVDGFIDRLADYAKKEAVPLTLKTIGKISSALISGTLA